MVEPLLADRKLRHDHRLARRTRPPARAARAAATRPAAEYAAAARLATSIPEQRHLNDRAAAAREEAPCLTRSGSARSRSTARPDLPRAVLRGDHRRCRRARRTTRGPRVDGPGGKYRTARTVPRPRARRPGPIPATPFSCTSTSWSTTWSAAGERVLAAGATRCDGQPNAGRLPGVRRPRRPSLLPAPPGTTCRACTGPRRSSARADRSEPIRRPVGDHVRCATRAGRPAGGRVRRSGVMVMARNLGTAGPRAGDPDDRSGERRRQAVRPRWPRRRAGAAAGVGRGSTRT